MPDDTRNRTSVPPVRRSRKRWIVAAAAAATAVSALAVWLLLAEDLLGPKQTAHATIVWRSGGTPMVITGEVIARDGRPLPNRWVRVLNTSGNVCATTDPAGRFQLQTAEVDLCEFEAESLGTVFWNRWRVAADRGLHFTVRER